MNEKHIDSNEVLLARIDERTKRLEDDMVSLKEQLTSRFVTKEEFGPIRNLVYGGVGLTLITVLSAILYLVVK